MKIAYCLGNPGYLEPTPSGDRTQQEGRILVLQRRGHRLTLVYPDHSLRRVVCATGPSDRHYAPLSWSDSWLFEQASRSAWRVQRLLRVPYLNVFTNLRIADACMTCLSGHDLVHERHEIYRNGVAMACRRLRLPYVLFFDADPIFESDYMGQPITGLLRRRARQLISYNLRAAVRVICVSDAAKRHLVNNWRTPVDRVAVLPNGVDTSKHRPRPESADAVRQSLALGEGPLVVFVGTFAAWHDTTTLIDSFRAVLAQYPQARLVLVGDGERKAAMQAYARSLDLGSSVNFTGAVPHEKIPHLVSAAHVVVAPYPKMQGDFWGSPMKILEYMACGAAIVASRIGQLQETIRDGHNGLLVEPGDADHLANAILGLLQDEELRTRLGRQARQDAVREHTWDQYARRLEAVYADALSAFCPGR